MDFNTLFSALGQFEVIITPPEPRVIRPYEQYYPEYRLSRTVNGSTHYVEIVVTNINARVGQSVLENICRRLTLEQASVEAACSA